MRKHIFKPHLLANVIPGEGVLVLAEDGGVKILHGKVYELVVPLIDGRRDEDEIVDALAGRVDGTAVYYALALLEKNGLITESLPDVPPQTAAFWHGMGIEPAAAIAAVGSARVGVHGVGDADPVPLRMALADAGFMLSDGETADFDAVVTDDYLRPELDVFNEASLKTDRPWLLVKSIGHEFWIGPLFLPGKTGCYRCLALRLARNRPCQRFVSEKNRLPEPIPLARAGVPATIDAACRLAAVELAKFIAGAGEGLGGRVMSLNVRTWETATHELLKHPACPACGRAEAAQIKAVELVNRRVTFVQDGGHRTRTPEQTIREYERLVSPITGVVKELQPVQNGDGPVHVYVAGHNPAFKMESLDFLKRSLRHASSGKGVLESQARVSALCEAIERYSGERTGSEFVVTASYREMRDRFGPDAIHPNQVMLYSAGQLAERAVWNARKSKFNRVVEPLDASAPIDWTPVWSLTHGRHKYLPAQLLYYQSKASATCDTFYCMGCSNGNASGNNLEEAVLQGFCELVERDATAIWWYNRLRKPAVEVESFEEPYLPDLISHYRSLGRDAWALDITSDLGIPSFAAVSRLYAGPEERILFGLGCHLDARIALLRAFSEMNQMLGIAQGNGEAKFEIEDEETLSWLKTATLANRPYIAPDESLPLKRREDFAMLHTVDLLEDIRVCRRIVEEQGLEVLVLDQTRPDVGMPVAKVIVPGLRPFWARFAPGRLYDVPVKMAWLPEALAEEDLNPVPVFF